MDQCSRHDIPPAVRGDLTDQQGHDLTVGLKALPTTVLTYWRLGDQPHPLKDRGGRSPLVAQLDLRSTWLESPHGKDGQLQSSGNSCHELVVARLGVCGTPIFQ